MKYRMLLRIMDDAGFERVTITSNTCKSAQSAAKEILHRFHDMEEEAARMKKPIDYSDELKSPSKRFQA
jgi:hypothetical protein